MALMFAICNPQPNWMPRKPKLMFQICQNVRGGLSMDTPDDSLAIVKGDQCSKSRAELAAQRARTITPFPVSAYRAGKIHARRAAQAQHILQRNNRNVSDRRQHRPDHSPVNLGIVMEVEIRASEVAFFPDILQSACAVAGAGTRPPTHSRVIVVPAGVGDDVAIVIMRTKRRALRIGAKC